MKKRRRPGGGRKPGGELRDLKAVMSLRMPQDLRDQLERARRASGRSLTQELLWRAKVSFDRDRELARDRALRAFCFLFSEVVDLISVKTGTEPEWRFDPWLFQTVKLAIVKLLDRFQPTGELKRSEYWEFFRNADIEGFPLTKEERVQITESPEAMADFAVQKVSSDFSNPGRAKHLIGWKASVPKMPKPSHKRILGELVKGWETTYYGMTDAQRDLEPKPKSRGGKS